MNSSVGGTVWPVSSLLLGTAILSMGMGLQSSLLGLRGGAEEFSLMAISLVMSSYYFGFLLGARFSPTLVNRVGHIRTFAALATLASIAPLLHAVLVTPGWWILFRIISGFCYAGLSLVVESWINEQTGREHRGTILSLYMAALIGGVGAGQVLLNVASPSGFELFVIVSVLISLSLIPIVLTTTTMPSLSSHSPLSLSHLLRQTPLGVVGCFASGLMLGAFWSLGSVYADEVGLDVQGVSLFMFSLLLGGVILQWPMGGLSDIWDRRLVIGIQNLLLAAGGYFMVREVVGVGDPLFYVAVAVIGGVLNPSYALSAAHVNDFLERDEYVPAGALLLLVYGVGAVVGPLVGGGLMLLLGPGGLFFLGITGGLSMGAYAFYRILKE